ncbi:uncharacterized protein [Periplaneta americana]|uniref:uncharacterized protein isoform X2 n=1 Tax=Periplaneta americana TaxID=6978 RepID=UPI0037E81C3E
MLGMKRAYGRTDADRICRLCSSNSGIIVLNIFDGEGKKRRILSLINSCLPVKISENDSLPKVICHHCLHKLEVFREFQESCLKSEETLRKFSTYSVTYPAFRNASQEFIRENEETVSRFSAELLPIPVPLEQHQQQSSGAVATTVVEERSEERTGVQRREIYEHSPADQLEVIMVKEEPQEEIAAGDEDSRWQDTSIEEENVMQAEETELDLISPGDRIKSEDCGSIEPPVLSEMKLRKRGVRNKDIYRSEMNKKARLSGSAYVNYKGEKVPAKTPGEPCGCHKNCFNHFSENERVAIFKHFYSFSSKSSQDTFLQSLIEPLGIQRRRPRKNTGERQLRSSNFAYYICKGNEKIRVCKVAQMNLLGVTSQRLRRLSMLLERQLPEDVRRNRTSCLLSGNGFLY